MNKDMQPTIILKDLDPKDYSLAVGYAIKGMHFDWYFDTKFLQRLYGWYFWYLEINRATQIIAAYESDRLVGVLLAEIKGEKRRHSSLLEKLYVSIIDIVQGVFSRDGGSLYARTTQRQLEHFLQSHEPDGEIIFLAADPDCKIKGVGSMLLDELARRQKGKLLYLYTDDACTYQFYEHRGFERVEDDEIVLKLAKGDVKLACFMYSRRM